MTFADINLDGKKLNFHPERQFLQYCSIKTGKGKNLKSQG